MPSRAGHLLIASPRLRDPNFAQTVVLIVREDDEGALGLVLNRPLEVSVAEACADQLEAAADVEAPIYRGGPCEGPLMILHAASEFVGDKIVDGVRFSADKEEIEKLMWDNPADVRYYAGYAGWAAKQLDNEIEEGGWLLTPAQSKHVFQMPHNALWPKLTTWMTMQGRVDIDRLPDDPSVN